MGSSAYPRVSLFVASVCFESCLFILICLSTSVSTVYSVRFESWTFGFFFFFFSHSRKNSEKERYLTHLLILECLCSFPPSALGLVIWYPHLLILECLFSFSPSALGLGFFPFCFFHMLLLISRVSVSRCLVDK